MELRKIIIYSISIPVVLYGAWFHFLSGQGLFGGHKQSIRQNAPSDEASAVRTASAFGESKQSKSFESALEWKKDPFLNKDKSGVAIPERSPKIRSKAKLPELSAISKTGSEKLAVVNGRVMRVGDRIGPWRLIDLTEDGAVFDGPDGSVRVKLGG